ncbi:acyltransferase [Aestuariispira insulae]|uniref:Transferase family hexapeptide repeat protein n=1 Tax=Aestuariispira insulae TaxID=1461337 RepID=A0A3D9H2P8_9PROT|nr:acyltransferase [Aestuariispira insulae]RED43783.1 transferase family hexapeptide repeat protein [Aestuariispira insulae]
MSLVAMTKQRLKRRDTALIRGLYRLAREIQHFDVPPVKPFFLAVHSLLSSVMGMLTYLQQILYWKPLFISHLRNRPRKLQYDGRGFPQILGPLEMTFGDNCRINAQTSFCGRSNGHVKPRLTVGNNVGISWRTGIYVGREIIIGNNVRIGGEGSLVGYPGHPLDARDRAAGLPDSDDQAKTIILEDDVWLARGVIVNGGVTIGRGTIVAAGSVVTKDLPPGVLAGGVPCKVIRKLP